MAKTRTLNKLEQTKHDRFLRLVYRQEQKQVLAESVDGIHSNNPEHIPYSFSPNRVPYTFDKNYAFDGKCCFKLNTKTVDP